MKPKATIKNTEFLDLSKIKKSSPIVITIKNTTDSIIKDVNLINFEHEKQNDIRYEGEVSHLSYNDILRFIMSASPKFKIGVTNIFSNNNVQPFVPLTFRKRHITGMIEQSTLVPRLDPHQNHVYVSILHHEFSLGADEDVIITKIMPNTKVEYALYLTDGLNETEK